MSVCLQCGHAELYYVGACGDGAVGSSNVLLYSGPELLEIQAEIALIQGLFDEIEAAREAEELEQLAIKQDALAALLKGYIPPTSGALPSKHLVQAYSITGKKWTYIRSDKMRNHWRSYGVDKSLLEADSNGQLPRGGLRGAWDKVAADIKSDIEGAGIAPKTRGTLLKGTVSASISDLWKSNFTEWVDAVNSSMSASTGNAYYDLSAAAQIFRAYAGFSVQLGYDPSDGSYGLSASGNARAVLAEAKADLAGYLPNRDGWHALFDWAEPATMSAAGPATQLDFGYFRFKAMIEVDAMVGASVMGTIGIEYTPEPNGEVKGKGGSYGGKGEVAAGAFAGAEASAKVKGGLEWDNPAKRASTGKLGWATVYEVGVQIAGNAGIGAEAHFKIEMNAQTGKLYIRAGAQLVIGVGAKGGITAAVGLTTIADFVMYIWQQLAANNFSLLSFISTAAFEAIKQLAYMLIVKPAEMIGRALGDAVLHAVDFAMRPWNEAQDKEDFARNVQRETEMLLHAPPEVKGRILYELGENHWGFDEYAEGAILVVMDSMQSRREWEQVIERVGPNGAKVGKTAGLARLYNVLDGGSLRTFNTQKAEIESRRIIAPDTAPQLYRTRFA